VRGSCSDGAGEGEGSCSGGAGEGERWRAAGTGEASGSRKPGTGEVSDRGFRVPNGPWAAQGAKSTDLVSQVDD
jgi:hypothetical protein